MKILHIVGARPNFMKTAPLIRELARYPQTVEQMLVHTGQHYDDNMSRTFFIDLELPPPDLDLGVGSGTHVQQMGKIMISLESCLREAAPDLVTVVGDVNSTLAAALAAATLGIKVAHIEAGLRSFDRTMPEEINRILTDHLADLLFTTEASATENLRHEGIAAEHIHFVGNLMIDTLVRLLPRAEKRWGTLASSIPGQRFVLVTLHRPSNVDDCGALSEIMAGLQTIAREVPVIFPVHPRTRARIKDLPHFAPPATLQLWEPLGYVDFLALMGHAVLVITDSGGVQEETTYLGVPCLTVRPNTERPVTVQLGTNRLVAGDCATLTAAAWRILREPSARTPCRPELWDGQAAGRIVDRLLQLSV